MDKPLEVSVERFNLSGHPQLTPHLRGPHDLVFLKLPKLGVSVLQLMTRAKD